MTRLVKGFSVLAQRGDGPRLVECIGDARATATSLLAHRGEVAHLVERSVDHTRATATGVLGLLANVASLAERAVSHAREIATSHLEQRGDLGCSRAAATGLLVRRGDVGRASSGDDRQEVTKAEREHTPPPLAAWLVEQARHAP